MLLYTHVITALKVKEALALKVARPGDYILGAILPDVRYLCGMPRAQTHVSTERLAETARECPDREQDLCLGYLVHLAADQLVLGELGAILFPGLPRALREKIPAGLFNVMLELGYQGESCAAVPLPRDAGTLGQHLGLPEEHVRDLAERAGVYIQEPSLEQAIHTVAASRFRTNPNVRFYIRAGRILHARGPLRPWILARVNRTKPTLETRLAQTVEALLREYNP